MIEILDSGDRTLFDSGAVRDIEAKVNGKDDREKLPLSQVPRGIVEAIGAVKLFGTKKYKDPDSWKLVENQRYWDAALRHVEAARNDMWAIDEESGLPHIWHLSCDLAFIIARPEEK